MLTHFQPIPTKPPSFGLHRTKNTHPIRAKRVVAQDPRGTHGRNGDGWLRSVIPDISFTGLDKRFAAVVAEWAFH